MARGGARKGRVRGGGQPAARGPGAGARRLGQLEAQPGRAGHRAGADAAHPARRLGRLAGPGRRGGRPVRGRRPAAAPRDLSAEDVENYYEGFSNDTLWPLYHDVVAPPSYHRHWWQAYVRVNERFAEAVDEVAAEGATVWVQDYQLQLVPGQLRERRPDLRIGFFLHIPFPPVELFLQLPWREQIVRGLLGADLVGFHTPGGARNFRTLATRLAGRGRAGTEAWSTAAATSSSAPSPSRSTSRRSTSCPAHPRSSRAPRRSATSWATRAACCSASTGSTTPRASTCGCAPSRSCSPRSGSRPTTRCSCRSRRPAGSGWSTTSGCAPRSSRPSGGSTATTAGSAIRRCTTCTSRCPATS